MASDAQSLIRPNHRPATWRQPGVPRARADIAPMGHIAAIKAYAICVVIVLHVSAAGAGAVGLVPMTSWWLAETANAVGRVGVPLFIMVSGATLLDESRTGDLRRFMGRRIRKVVLPYLVWALVYLLLRREALGEDLTVSAMAREIVVGPVFYHLPFVPLILGLYLAAPVLARFADNASRPEAVYFVILWASFGPVLGTLAAFGVTPIGIPPTVFTDFVGYFVIGRLLRDVALSRRAARAAAVLAALGAVTTVVLTWSISHGRLDERFHEYGRPNNAMAAIAVFLAVSSAPSRALLQRPTSLGAAATLLAGASFGLYLLHPLVLLWLEPVLNWASFGPLVGLPLTTFAVILFSWGAVLALRQHRITAWIVP